MDRGSCTGYNTFKIGLKRNIPGSYNEHNALIATHSQRKILYRVTVASVNDQKQVTYTKSTGVKAATLDKNSHIQLLKLDPADCTFPLLLSFNFAVSPMVDIGESGESGNEQATNEHENLVNLEAAA